MFCPNCFDYIHKILKKTSPPTSLTFTPTYHFDITEATLEVQVLAVVWIVIAISWDQ